MRKPTPSVLGDVLSTNTAPTMLELERIKIDGGTQMRAGLHEPTVLEYLAEMAPAGWAQFPPVIAYYDGADYWLADGFHRVEAIRRAAAQVDQPADRIPADVRAGTRRDAILYAAGANAQHGLRRTNADKRRAVEALLRDEEWRQWSDREIARRCEVDNSFVSRVRRELSVDKPQIAERTVQRNGTTYTQNTTNIGATRTYASGLPALEMPTGSKESFSAPPERFQIVGCVDTLAWEAVPASDVGRIAHMEAAENFQYYLDGVRKRIGFPVNLHAVKDAIKTNIAAMLSNPEEPEAPASILAEMPDDLIDTWSPRFDGVGVYLVDVERNRSTETVALDELDELFAQARRMDEALAPIVVDGDRPLPEWAVTQPDEIAEVLTPDAGTEAIPDMRIAKMARLINVYSQTIMTFDEYGNLTGSFTETLPAQRELEKLIKHLRREMALLEGQPVEDGWGVLS